MQNLTDTIPDDDLEALTALGLVGYEKGRGGLGLDPGWR
jgi:hypothetical protein